MNEEQAKEWTRNKSNQQAVSEKFFKKYQPSNTKVAFFMAGIPGAGKTEFVENTIREALPSFVPIEHDKLVEYIKTYTPGNYYNYRKAGSALVTRIFNDCLNHDYGLIFDGTLSHENGLHNIKKAMKSGYEVYVIYIVQEPKMAWELTKARELIRKRSIKKAGFINTCNKINKNLLTIFEAFSKETKFNFWIINKRGSAGMESASAIIHGAGLDNHIAIEKALEASYNLDVIK